MAYVDFICKSHLQGVNLQKQSTTKITEGYEAALKEALQLAGKSVALQNGHVLFSVAPVHGKSKERCVDLQRSYHLECQRV